MKKFILLFFVFVITGCSNTTSAPPTKFTPTPTAVISQATRVKYVVKAGEYPNTQCVRSFNITYENDSGNTVQTKDLRPPFSYEFTAKSVNFVTFLPK